MEGYFQLVYGGRNGGRADCKGSIGQIRRRKENYDARVLDGEQINQNDLASANMSAFGTKRTCPSAPHMSAFGGKADILDRKADIELAPITVFIGAKLGTANYHLNDWLASCRKTRRAGLPRTALAAVRIS
jgi:hypothetical protein